MRTLHLLKTPDILCANDSRPTVSYPLHNNDFVNQFGRVLAVHDEVADAHGSTPARVALAGLLAKPGITDGIASATKEKHLTDMVEAAKLKLDAESIKKLNEASARKHAAADMAR